MDTEMNERIRQLAEQARKHFPKTETSGEFWVFDEEKFAELIIKECMSCADFVGITNDRIGLGPMPIRYTSMVNDQIKKHFGVENV